MKKQVPISRYAWTFLGMLITIAFLFKADSNAQIAAGESKFLGNIIPSSIPSNYADYWNQVTPENAGKWDATEPSRDNMNWNTLDQIYNYAKSNGMPFKAHTFVWGSQEPSWMSSLSASEQKAEVEEWIKAFGERYPNADYIDVVNEPLHAPASYRNAIGGAGSTGWDWIVWSFEKARQYCPNAKLLINEYGIINDPGAISDYLEIVNILKSRGLIDGIGFQAHCFNIDNMTASQLKTNLDLLASAGLPLYVAELDIRGDDNLQKQRYETIFPALWNHSAVKGVTLWGWIEGQTWKETTQLVTSTGQERPSMVWLKSFFDEGSSTPPTTEGNIIVRAKGIAGGEIIEIKVNDNTVKTINLSTSYQEYGASGDGTVKIEFTNDGGDRDVQVDWVKIDGTTLQAEDQQNNTAVYQDGSCGGSYSEMMHCGGYIEFNSGGSTTPEPEPDPVPPPPPPPTNDDNIIVRAKGMAGGETIEIKVDNSTVKTINLSTSFQEYSASGNGTLKIEFTNDGGDRDVQVDWVKIDGITHQAEDQQNNTAVYQDGSCGGSFSEMMHCGGFIEFGTGSDPEPEPEPVPDPPASTGCNGVAAWNASTVYAQSGTQVEYNGNLYQNRWYSSNQNPEQNSGPWMVWEPLGACKAARESMDILSNVDIYPNPVHDGMLYINLPDEASEVVVELINLQGRTVQQAQYSNQSFIEYKTDVTPGLYFIRVSSGTKLNYQRIVIN